MVTVTKKDGTTKTEHVRAVSRPFDVQGVPHVYGYIQRVASGSGSICDECGEALRGRGIPCVDSSGIAGTCCPRCAQLPAWERSFA